MKVWYSTLIFSGMDSENLVCLFFFSYRPNKQNIGTTKNQVGSWEEKNPNELWKKTVKIDLILLNVFAMILSKIIDLLNQFH